MVVQFYLEFEFEVAVIACGAEKGVDGALAAGCADNFTVLHAVGGISALHDPVVEGLSVEEGHPLGG